MKKHFKKIKEGEFTFGCPKVTVCAGFFVKGDKLICDTCNEEIQEEAIKLGVIAADNRKI